MVLYCRPVAQTRGWEGLPGALTVLVGALVTNLFTVVGIVWLGMSPGNAFVLFVVENILVGVSTFVTLRRTRAESTAMNAKFFALHFGTFTGVHAIFTTIIAAMLGVDATFFALVLPVLILLFRFFSEIWAVIRATAAGPVMRPPSVVPIAYGRVVPLHLGVIAGLMAGISSLSPADSNDFAGISAFGLDFPRLVVLGLLVVKTIADVIVAIVIARTRSTAGA